MIISNGCIEFTPFKPTDLISLQGLDRPSQTVLQLIVEPIDSCKVRPGRRLEMKKIRFYDSIMESSLQPYFNMFHRKQRVPLLTISTIFKAVCIGALSVSNTVATIFFPCLNLSLITIFCSTMTAAQPQPLISREALFIRAYKSAGFFLHMAQQDESFAKSLTSPEREMLDGIYAIAIGTATFNWLVENKVERFGKPGNYYYAYAITKNRLVRLPTPFERPIAIVFKNDPDLFNLDPKQPPRDAVTGAAMDTDIFVNLDRINRADLTYDLASVTSLMIHEFGHKLADKKNQSAVDGLAAKMENYLRSTTNTSEVNGKKVSLLRFRNMPSYDQFVEDVLYGRYIGVNIPPQVHFLSAFDQQGVYAWVEDNGKVKDITDIVTAPIRRHAVVQHIDDDRFHFVKHNIVLADSMTVAPVGDKDFKISIISNLQQFVVPFMKTGSYDPYAYNLYERVFKSPYTHNSGFYGYDYTIDGEDFRLKKARHLPQIFSRPQYEVGYVSKKVNGTSLELYFSIKGLQGVNLGRGIPSGEWWPEIKLQIGSTETLIKATQLSPETGLFQFVIKDFDKIKGLKVSVTGIQMRIKDQLLVLSNSSTIARLFLPSEILVADGSGSSASKPPVLKSVQAWDGKNWTILRKNAEIKEGLLLRFIFDSTEPLRELSIDQRFSVRTEVSSTFMGNAIPSTGVEIEDQERSIRIESDQMRQNFNAGKLYVDVNIDHRMALALKVGGPILIDHSGTPTGGPLIGSGFTENYSLTIEKDRAITGISFVTQSGQFNEFNLKNPLAFIKPSSGGDLPDDSSAIYHRARCLILFID